MPVLARLAPAAGAARGPAIARPPSPDCVASHADENVRARAIPAFGQRFLGDDELHRARFHRRCRRSIPSRSFPVHAFLAGGDDDFIGGNAAGCPSVPSHPLHVAASPCPACEAAPGSTPVAADTGAPWRRSIISRRLQLLAPIYGIGQAFLPVAFGFQQDRQLDHVLRFQFRGATRCAARCSAYFRYPAWRSVP